MATVNQQEMGLQGGANMAEAATLKMNCSGGYEEEGVKTERREGSGGPLKTHTQTETHTHGDTHTETHREGDRYLVGQVQGDSCRMSLFEFWRTRKERGQVLQRSRETKLSPSELKQLLCDSGVRAALGGSKVASLLPPVDKEVFRRFTAASQEESQQQHDAKKEEDNDKDTMIGQPRPAEDLEAGKPLPFFYGDPPPELLNTPLEELDPFYQSEQTFLVLGRGNVIHRFSSGPSCFLFRPLSPVRIAAIRVLIHWLFRFVVVATILTNCVFMTMKRPPYWSSILGYVFSAVYTLELLVKVVARGVCGGRFSFLRDPWNWLDVLVVSTLYVSEFVNLRSLVVLLLIPVILKLLPLIPGMKSTVKALNQSARRLAGVMLLTVFGLSIFAIIGQHIFMGSLRQRCLIWPINISDSYLDNGSRGFDFMSYITNETNQYFLPGQLDALLCGNASDSGSCPEGFTCMSVGKNPNYGYTNFDWFGPSLLNMIRLLSKDFWENLFMLTLRASGQTHLLVFILVFFPGCFCLLCFILAVVAMAIGEQEKAAVVEARLKENDFLQIQAALMSINEDEPAASRAALSQTEDSKEGGSGDTCPSLPSRLCPESNCCSCWLWLKLRLHTVVMDPLFDLGVILILIINTLFMAVEHYPMTEHFERTLSEASLVFTFIFLAEMVLKIVAMGPSSYFKVGWNIFDSIIVVLTILELAIRSILFGSPFSFNLLRVFRLARWWPSFRLYLKLVWSSLWALRNLTLVLVLVVFLYSVVGLHLFGRDYKDCVCRIAQDCELPRWHMNDFFHSFLMVFRVLVWGWIETMWDCMEVSNKTTCVVFFMTLMIVGKLLVLSLFLTLLLSWICSESLVPSEQTESPEPRSALVRIFRKMKKKKKEEDLVLDVVTSDPTRDQQNDAIARTEGEPEPEGKKEEKEKKKKEDRHSNHDDLKTMTPEDCCCEGCYHCCPLLDLNKSQSTGRVWSNFRRTCLTIVQHQTFETFIIIIIVMSSLALVFEDIHLPQRHSLKQVVEAADQVFTFVFLLEMLLKWSALGLRRYFTDAWCWLDFIILNVSLTCFTADLLGLSGLGTAICSMRALMPLRVLSRFRGLRVVIQTLLRSLPTLLNVVLVSVTVWLVFSILGVNLFAGKFRYCFNETSEEYFLSEDVHNKSECFYLMDMNFTEIRWKNIYSNFDSVGSGYLSLFLVALSASPMDVFYASTDATLVEDQPVYENNLYAYLYFVVFMIANFFIFNFIVRATVDSLRKDKSEGKCLFVTEVQMKLIKDLKTRLSRSVQTSGLRPQSSCRARLFDLVTSSWFAVVMVTVICLNMVVLMIESYDQSMEMEEVLYWFHFSLFIIFFIEFILKVGALGRPYFTSGWNILDFVVLLMSFIGIFIADLVEKYFVAPHVFPIFRLARVAQVIHLLPWCDGIRKLLWAFVMSLPAVCNISVIFCVLTFSFSIFAMFNFALLKKMAIVDDMYNFETFRNSLTCLILTSYSSDWFGLLLPLLATPPDCDPFIESPGLMTTGDCGNPGMGVAFFTTFIILSSLLLLYLNIAVILETFDSEEHLSDHDLDMFYNTWRTFDRDASRSIQYSELSDFCSSLKDPLRIPKPNSIRLTHMDLPLLPGDKICCEDILVSLSSQVFGDSSGEDSLKTRLNEKFTADSAKVSCDPISSTLQRKQEEVAASVIQRAFRKRLQKHGDGEGTEGSVGGAKGGSGV